MRLVDLGLQAITAPTPSSSSRTTGVAALAAAAGLAVLGAAKRFRDPFKNLPIFDFGTKTRAEVERDSQRQFAQEMAVRGINVSLPLMGGDAIGVWADWATERGEMVGPATNADHSGVPHIEVNRSDRPAETVQFVCPHTKAVPLEDAPRVLRNLLDRVGYDGAAIVPLYGWVDDEGGCTWRCRDAVMAPSLYITHWPAKPLWKTAPKERRAPLSSPTNFVMVASYRDKLPRKS